jgi:hypothetical protein
MATTKQIEYVKMLINKIKTSEYLSKPFEYDGEPELREHALKFYQTPRREWMLTSLYGRNYNPYKFENVSYEDAKTAFFARIAELEETDFSQLDNLQVSQVIDNLKRCFIGFSVKTN